MENTSRLMKGFTDNFPMPVFNHQVMENTSRLMKGLTSPAISLFSTILSMTPVSRYTYNRRDDFEAVDHDLYQAGRLERAGRQAF